MPALTQESFDATSWHDNYVHALRLVDGEREDGTGELWLDLDHILEWLDGDETSFLFRIVRAQLRFIDVMSLRVELDYSSVAMGPFQIDGISRRVEQRQHREATIWTIDVTYPPGEIQFEATSYVQESLGSEYLVNRQWLTRAERGDV